MLTFVELQPFAAVRDKYLEDMEYAKLQWHLIGNPEAGNLIPRSGGCRKLRWALEGRGKRGGARVIYFLHLTGDQVVLVTMYAKNVRDNIDPLVLRKLKKGFEDG